MDERLRKLEREANQGDAGATVRLLVERVRLGQVSDGRLRLAAYLGEPTARELLGDRETSAAKNAPADALEWVRALETHGREACVRAALTAARRNVPASAHPVSADVATALDATASWLVCPCESHQANVRQTLEAALGSLFRRPRYSYTPEVFNGGRAGVAAAAVVLHPSTLLNRFYQPLIAQSLGLRSYTYSLGTLTAAAFYWTLALGHCTRDELRESIRSDLIAWALGMEPPELRVRADDVFGDVTPYRKRSR